MELSINLVIVIANVALSLAVFSNRDLFGKLLFNPYRTLRQNEWYRTVTHAFIHADYIHLFFNMYVLYQFGGLIETIFTDPKVFANVFPTVDFWGVSRGYLYFVILYFGGMLAATLPAFKKHKDNPAYNSVGASGAVSAVVLAIIIALPTMQLYLFFIPIGIPAFIIGIAYLTYEYFMSKKGRTGIAHDAHLWGGLFGLVFMLAIEPRFGMYFLRQVGAFFGGLLS